MRIDRVDALACAELACAESDHAPIDAACVSRVVDAAFAQRRKTIRNSMSSNGFDKAALDVAFEACGIAPTARAEALTTDEFIKIAAVLSESFD